VIRGRRPLLCDLRDVGAARDGLDALLGTRAWLHPFHRSAVYAAAAALGGASDVGRVRRAVREVLRLTAGQRYHFLTGWFSWFADALHLVFAFGAIAWTIGAVAAPQFFPLPLDLYLVPVLAFLAAKIVFGPVLYRARVDCSWADVVGASAASMALSHAIARGVIEGLWRRTGEFKRTAKGGARAPRFAWLAAIREETLLFGALALAVAAVVWRFGTDHVEAMLWAIALAAQALPYAATIVVAWVSARDGMVAAAAPKLDAPAALPELRAAA